MPQVLVALAIVFSCLTCFSQAASAAPSPNGSQSLEADIYKLRFNEVQTGLQRCQQQLEECRRPRTVVEDMYARRYYEQEAELRDVEVAIYRWQMFAANVILTLVVLVTLAAILFCAYQLWRSSRFSKLPPNLVDVELSVSRLKFQTSLIGVVVLIASYGFLIVFTREIYQLRAVDRGNPPSPAHSSSATGSSSAPR